MRLCIPLCMCVCKMRTSTLQEQQQRVSERPADSVGSAAVKQQVFRLSIERTMLFHIIAATAAVCRANREIYIHRSVAIMVLEVVVDTQSA